MTYLQRVVLAPDQRLIDCPHCDTQLVGSDGDRIEHVGDGSHDFIPGALTAQAAALGLTPSQADALSRAYFPATTKETP